MKCNTTTTHLLAPSLSIKEIFESDSKRATDIISTPYVYAAF